MNNPAWIDGMDVAITVCDREGIIVYMNDTGGADFRRRRGQGPAGEKIVGLPSRSRPGKDPPPHGQRSQQQLHHREERREETDPPGALARKRRTRPAWWNFPWSFPRPCPTLSGAEPQKPAPPSLSICRRYFPRTSRKPSATTGGRSAASARSGSRPGNRAFWISRRAAAGR